MPSLPRKATALCGLESVAAGVELCRALQMLAPDLEAADFFDEASLALACARRGLSKPFEDDFPFYVVVDVATAADPVEQLGAAFAHSGHDSNVLFSDDPRGRIGLWAYREVLNEAVSSGGVPLKLDVGLPIHALEAFTKQCASLCARASARPNLYLWGHLGDGNVHVNIVGAGADESELAEEVLRLVAAAGGTVSAEHGIGRAKTEWLHLTRSPAELDLIRAIKHAFDPSGLLSPGRVFAIGGREGEYRGSPQPR